MRHYSLETAFLRFWGIAMLRFSVSKIDLSGVAKHIQDSFGKGSDGQEKWSMMTFEGAEFMTPQATGRFLADSKAATRQVAADGYVIYTGIPYGGPYQRVGGTGRWQGFDFASTLWHGKQFVPYGGGRTITVNFTNPNAEPRWMLGAARMFGDEWLKDYQAWVDRGGS